MRTRRHVPFASCLFALALLGSSCGGGRLEDVGGEWSEGHALQDRRLVGYLERSDFHGALALADSVIETGERSSRISRSAPAPSAGSAGTPRVTYGRDGRVTSGAASFRITAGSNNTRSPMRCIDISASGRPNTRADSNGTDSDGCN